jgi:hypothetical protein
VGTKPVLIISHLPAAAGNPWPVPAFNRLAALSDYWTLTEPEVNFLIVIATLTGFVGSSLFSSDFDSVTANRLCDREVGERRGRLLTNCH